MNDILAAALERRRELHGELAEIDEFIRMAKSLLRNAKPKPGWRPDGPALAGPADTPVRREFAERPQIVEIPDTTPEPVVCKFPWSGAQPPVRKTGADEAGPTRRNLMRREAG